MHYFLNQRQYFKNLYSYQGHLKKFPVTKKKKRKRKKKKKLEREENVDIKYKRFKY